MQWQVDQLIQERYQLRSLKRDRPGHQVWLAFDQQSHTQVILKTLAFTGEIQWDEVKLFEREIEVLQRLQHPRTPSLIDVFNQDQPYFCKCLVETYIHAPSLQAFLDRHQKIPDAQVWAIAAQVLGILRDLHRHNPPILHRDLKPSNILIDANKQVYLIDLGSVGMPIRSTQDNSETATTVGSYGYTPLEQFMGQAVPASDLYALGATLMQLLSETHPADLINQQLRLTLPGTLEYSVPLKQWLYDMTTPQVSDRIPSADQAIRRLEQAQTQTRMLVQSSHHVSARVTVAADSEMLTVRPMWNTETVARADVLMLLGLGVMPPILGLVWAIAVFGNASGFNLLGSELLIAMLSFLPTIVVGPKLFWNLVHQSLLLASSGIQLQRKIAGVIVRQHKTTLNDISDLSIQSDSSGLWEILSRKQTHPLLKGLSRDELHLIYRTLEQWLT